MSKIRQSARGEDCTIRIPGICNHTPETVVLCHPNTHRAGKGKGLKAADELGAYGCYACHMVVDGQQRYTGPLSREEIELCFWHGHAETYLKLKSKGLVK